MGLVRRDWTWNKTDLGSHLPTSSFGRQLLLIYLVPGTVVSTQRFALSLFLIFSFYRPSDLIHSNTGVSNLQAQIGTSCQINGSIRLDIKCTINAICLNHSETISPPLVFGKIIFHEIGESKVAQSCPTLCDPMDYTVHGLLQARILEWVVFPPGALPNPGIETRSPALQMESLPAEPKKGGNHCSNGHNSESYTSSPDCFLSF